MCAGPASEAGTGTNATTSQSFTLTRSDYEGQGDHVVTFIVEGTATNGVDFVMPGVAGFAAGQRTTTITVTPIQDCIDEISETVTIYLTDLQGSGLPTYSGSQYKVGTPSSATIYIEDNDDQPTLSIGNWTGLEPNQDTAVSFPVTLSCQSPYTTTVNYFTSPGTAIAPGDFAAVASGQIQFLAGETSKSATVTIKHDTIHENSETFTVNLFNPSNAALGTSAGTGTITNNDPAPAVASVSSPSVTEPDDDETVPITFTVTLTNASVHPTTVTYNTENYNPPPQTTPTWGKARVDKDYVGAAANATLVFAPLETSKTITITVKGDEVYEGNETFTLTAGSVTGTGTINEDEKPPKEEPPACDSCGGGPGELLGDNGAGNSGAPPGFSPEGGTRYSDGAAVLSATDLYSGALGRGWGVERSWSSAPGYAPRNIIGHGMVLAEQPFLIEVGATALALVTNATTARYFDRVGASSNYQGRHFLQETLRIDAATSDLVLTDTTGAKMHFHGFAAGVPEGQQGRLKHFTDSDGNDITAESYTIAGDIQELRRAPAAGTDAWGEALVYNYSQIGNDQLVSSIELRKQYPTGSWSTVRRAEYGYYGASELHGNQGDLKTVTIRASAGGPALETTYYRYYKEGEAYGYEHGLKYVFTPASYERLSAALGGNALSSPDEAVAPYADYRYRYDTQRRVSQVQVQGAGCGCSGGLGTIGHSYVDLKATSPATYVPDYNHWRTLTVESLPDGNLRIVYANEYGQMLLSVFRDPDSDGAGPEVERNWSRYYHYDANGRVDWNVDEGGVLGFSEALPDLVGYQPTTGRYDYLSDNAGLFTYFSYYTGTETPVASSTTAGSAPGYLQAVSVREGELGENVPLSLHNYFKFTDGVTSVYHAASNTLYASIYGTEPLTTNYGYVASGLRIERMTTVDPTGATTEVLLDEYGRPTWVKDAEGYLHWTSYQQTNGSPFMTIQDVDTTVFNVPIFRDEIPSGWETPAGGGQHIITHFANDAVEQPIWITQVSGNSFSTFFKHNDAAHESRSYPGRVASSGTFLLPTVVTREDRARGYIESLTMPAYSSQYLPTGNELIKNLQSLSRTYFNTAGQVDHVDLYTNLAGLVYSQNAHIGTSGVHYERTSFGYDSRGRQNRLVRADGLIYRTVYDGLGRPTSEWVGMNDVPLVGFWSESNPAGMRRLKQYQYDSGGAGATRLIEMTDAEGRVTKTEFDFRGQLIKLTLPDPDPNDAVPPPTHETRYDNLGRVKETFDPFYRSTNYFYNHDANLQTRVTRTQLPAPFGEVADAPVFYQEFNARGLLISQTDPEGRVTSYTYDGAGRMRTMTGPDPDGSGTAYTAPVTQYQYTKQGSLASVTDPLGNVTWYGHDNGMRLKEVHQPDPDGWQGPLQSPRTIYNYDAAGRLLSLTDPVGNATTWYYDAAGRVTSEVNQLGQARTFVYDAAGRLAERVDRLGRKIAFSYNDLDQVSEERWYEGSTLVRTLSFSHDDSGWLESAADVAAAYTYVPDGMGRVKSETQSIAGLMGGAAIQYASQYNAAGFRTQLTAAIDGTADFQNSYVPDGLQRLVTFMQHSNGGSAVAAKRFDFKYNKAGQVTALHRYSDLWHYDYVASSHYQYDQAGRLARLTHAENQAPPTSGFGAGALAGYQFTYDAASRITQVNSLLDGLSTYGYDKQHQLKTADHAVQTQADEAYQYDANGNRIGGGYVTGLNNQLLADGTYRYAYDVEGNRIRRTHLTTGVITQYTYDHRNRLTGVTDVNPALATTDGWGSTSGTAQYSDIEGGDWGWGPSTGGGGGDFDGAYGYYADIWYYYGFTAVVMPATEGQPVRIWVSADREYNPENYGVDVEMRIEDVSAVGGLDYVSGYRQSWHTAGPSSGDVSAYHEIATIDDAVEETTQSFKVHLRLQFFPEIEIVLEADIFDNDFGAGDVTVTAQAAAAMEGQAVLLLVSATAEAEFEYRVLDMTAVAGTDYAGPSSWTPLGVDGQAAIPTFVRPGDNGSRSFQIITRVIGRPETQIELEADILDQHDILVQSVEYAYDVFNRLVRRTHDADGVAGPLAASERFFSWEANQIVFQFDGTTAGSLSHRYAWNPLATDHILADENALNEVLWPLLDHLGTARDLVEYDAAATDAAIVNHRIYDSFGKLIHESDDGYSIAFGFTGVYVEVATGLNYHRARWYDPLIGKWISLDPIGFLAGQANLGAYVHNSPVNLVDPSGLAGAGDGHHFVVQSLWPGLSHEAGRSENSIAICG